MDIVAGEVVLSERASAAVLNFDLHLTTCSHCFEQTSSLIPCCWCAGDGYCSGECREDAWVEYHWIECPVSDNMWGKADWMTRVALRMVVSAPATVLKGVLSKGLDSTITDSSKHFSTAEPYAALLSLVSHKDRFSDKQQTAMFSKMAETMMECFGDTIKAYLNSKGTDPHDHSTPEVTSGGLRSLFLHHLLQLRCNSHRVTAVLEAGEVAGRGESVKSSHEATLGSAVFPTASLFNHSCWPNIIFRFQGSKVEAVATRPIRNGDEACNCYGPQLGRMKRAERVAELQTKYFFHCSCPACAGSDASLDYRETVMDAYWCPVCSGAVTDAQWQCRDCHTQLESSDIERMQELRGETERMFSTANVDGQLDLPLLLKCHSLQSRVLHSHNMQLARTCDALAEAHASTGEFGKAAEFCAASCRAVEAVHGSQSIELATELHKLAQLLFNSGQFGRAVEVVEKALPLMRVYHHSPCHPDITELQQIKNLICT
ncbi:SET and MYND domain-containing protein 4 [Geodia barretti]|nr:SET and MYND domain-containing protein 4 [Geodia barretti]